MMTHSRNGSNHSKQKTKNKTKFTQKERLLEEGLKASEISLKSLLDPCQSRKQPPKR